MSNIAEKDKHQFNETKFLILKCIFQTTMFLTPRQIMKLTCLSSDAVHSCLWRLHKGNYIFRRKEKRKNKKNYYSYMFLKGKGRRVLESFNERKKIDPLSSLNLKKSLWYMQLQKRSSLKT